MKTLSIDHALPMMLTKSNIQSYANSFIEEVKEGNVNPIEIACMLNGLETAIKTIKDGIRDIVLDELKEGGKASFNGVKIEKMEAGGRYDFSQCGDPIWDRLKEAAEEIKERELLLKSLPKTGLEITDQETGELYTVYPPSKPATTTTYKITFPK